MEQTVVIHGKTGVGKSSTTVVMRSFLVMSATLKQVLSLLLLYQLIAQSAAY